MNNGASKIQSMEMIATFVKNIIMSNFSIIKIKEIQIFRELKISN